MSKKVNMILNFVFNAFATYPYLKSSLLFTLEIRGLLGAHKIYICTEDIHIDQHAYVDTYLGSYALKSKKIQHRSYIRTRNVYYTVCKRLPRKINQPA